MRAVIQHTPVMFKTRAQPSGDVLFFQNRDIILPAAAQIISCGQPRHSGAKDHNLCFQKIILSLGRIVPCAITRVCPIQ